MENGGCSHICGKTPDTGNVQCDCPGESNHLAPDEKTCMGKFLIVENEHYNLAT